MDPNIECLIGREIDEASLVGRGWWPIKDGKINRRKRPLKRIKILKNFECAYSTFTLNDVDGEMSQFNWAKSVPFYEDESDGTTFLIFALKVESGKIVAVGEFEKDCQDQSRLSFGFGFVEIPRDGEEDEEMPYEMYSLCIDNFQAQRMIDEVEKAIAGRYLGSDRELVGRKLPARLEHGGDSGLSTVRNCYWSYDLHVEDRVVVGMNFSTYISHGSCEANMFSRPQSAPDHIEDIIYALLRVIDAYSDEEWIKS